MATTEIHLITPEKFSEVWQIPLPVVFELMRRGLPHYDIDQHQLLEVGDSYQWMRKHYYKGDADDRTEGSVGSSEAERVPGPEEGRERS